MSGTVKIVRFHRTGDPSVLQFDALPLPEPGEGELRLRVKALGLNRAEIMFRSGVYLWTADLPAQLGFEASGIVEAVGPGVDPALLGRKVSTLPTFDPVRYGVYGEVTVVPASCVSEYPEHLSFAEAAAIWVQYLTAYGGLIHFGNLKAGDFVLITAGSSSTGLAAIQMVRAEGGTSIVTTRTAAKKAELLASGADHVIVTDEEDVVERVMAITGGEGARLIYDPIGGPNLEVMVQAAAVSGTIIEYGMLSTEPTMLPLFDALDKYLSIKAYDVHELFDPLERIEPARKYVLAQIAAGKLRPQIDRIFPFEQIADAHRYMEASNHVGKIVVAVGQEGE